MVHFNLVLRLISVYKDNKWLKYTFVLTFLNLNLASDCCIVNLMSKILDDPKFHHSDFRLFSR